MTTNGSLDHSRVLLYSVKWYHKQPIGILRREGARMEERGKMQIKGKVKMKDLEKNGEGNEG